MENYLAVTERMDEDDEEEAAEKARENVTGLPSSPEGLEARSRPSFVDLS